jgi:hypothetical protein
LFLAWIPERIGDAREPVHGKGLPCEQHNGDQLLAAVLTLMQG